MAKIALVVTIWGKILLIAFTMTILVATDVNIRKPESALEIFIAKTTLVEAIGGEVVAVVVRQSLPRLALVVLAI